VGALLTGVFKHLAHGGTGIVDYVNNTIVDTTISGQLWIQAQGVLTTLIWSGVVAFICYKVVDLTIGLRVQKKRNAKVWIPRVTENALTAFRPSDGALASD